MVSREFPRARTDGATKRRNQFLAADWLMSYSLFLVDQQETAWMTSPK
jgi:4'-phosphopantetheinyl transferase EntD